MAHAYIVPQPGLRRCQVFGYKQSEACQPGGPVAGCKKDVLVENMVSNQFVHIQRQNRVALVTMDNPATLNAMDEDLGPELARSLELLSRDQEMRCVVLTGAGGVFSGGGNVVAAHEYIQTHQGAGSLFAEYTKWVKRLLAALTRMPQPVICAVRGASSGAGLGWMLASDFVICDEKAKLVPGFLAIGLVPGAGVSLTLPRLLRLPRASELLYLNRKISPQEALAWGMVDELKPADQVLPRAMELAAELAAGPAGALAASKALINQATKSGLMVQSENERRAVMSAADLPEFRERVTRFVQGKRS
jgi:2-(1,2-epoxy-1,2-dihydrophenyl)acetyl-CoA isomerase